MNSQTMGDWLEDLASKTPTPGGGTVAALSAAISAGQLGMVTAYTVGPKWQDREDRMKELENELSTLRVAALKLIDADAEAFKAVGASYQMPKTTEDEKSAKTIALQKALTLASDPPSQVASLAIRLVEISAELAKNGNPQVISDVAVGASIARTALESAIVNIEINQRSITDSAVKSTLQTAIAKAQDAIQEAENVLKVVREQLK